MDSVKTSERAPTSVTLGCRLNAYESEVMSAHAKAAGVKDAVIINTCAVTNQAVRASRQAVRRAVRENPEREIIVTGCAAQIDPKSFAQIGGVSRVLGNEEKMQAQTFSDIRAGKPPDPVTDIMQGSGVLPAQIELRKQGRVRAFVQVQNGCDHRCTFCIIPYGRGRSRSVPAGEVVRHVRGLCENGAAEIVLTGVDISSWGDDLPGRPALGNLVRRILTLVPGLARLRLSSIDPAEIDDELFNLIVSDHRIAPYLHLSMQHGHTMMLKRMKRRHSREQAVALCARLRASRPDITFGADLIAGFPTETEEMHAHNISLITKAGLTWSHIFPFSPRNGTPAARMPQLPGPVIKQRAAAMRRAAQAAKISHLARRANGSFDLALIEKVSPDGVKARLADFTPVSLPAGRHRRGSLAAVRLDRHSDDGIIGSFA